MAKELNEDIRTIRKSKSTEMIRTSHLLPPPYVLEDVAPRPPVWPAKPAQEQRVVRVGCLTITWGFQLDLEGRMRWSVVRDPYAQPVAASVQPGILANLEFAIEAGYAAVLALAKYEWADVRDFYYMVHMLWSLCVSLGAQAPDFEQRFHPEALVVLLKAASKARGLLERLAGMAEDGDVHLISSPGVGVKINRVVARMADFLVLLKTEWVP